MSKDFNPFCDYKEAVIYAARDQNGRLSDHTSWYVYFKFRIPNSTKFKMFKRTMGMNRIRNLKQRMSFATSLQREINANLKAGFNPFGVNTEGELLLSNCIQKFLNDHVKNLRSRTFSTNKSGIMHLQWYFEKHGNKNIYLYDVTKDHIISALDYWQKKKTWTNRSRNNNLARWRTFFNWFMDRTSLEKNPTARIKFEKVYPTDVNRPPTEEEFKAIVNHLYQNNRPLFLYAMTIYYQGFRVTETGLLKASQIEFSADKPFFRLAAKNQKDNETIIHYVSPHLLPFYLEAGFDKLPSHFNLFSKKLMPSEFTLLKIKEEAESQWKNEVKKKLKINVGLYSMKHKQATELGATVSDKEISEFLRHSDQDVTRLYMRDKRPIVKYSFFENQRPLPLNNVKIVKIKKIK